MSRPARKKSMDSMYHVMSRSISEKDLFLCNEDKDYYLSLLKRYKEKHHCHIYSYCLMDNHVHIFINPNGFDISRFMLCLNTAYVTYFNKRYDRHGHLFQGRFASRIVEDATYALILMAYIHNNAEDMPGYAGREESYQYSSYGIYTGHMKDVMGIVDTGFLLKIFNSEDKGIASQKCYKFTKSMQGTDIMEEVDVNIVRAYTENEYRDEKMLLTRNANPEELIRKMGDILGIRITERLKAKHIRETSRIRAFATYVMRILCGYTYKMICEYIGNMSISGVSRLINEGFRLTNNHLQFRNTFNILIQ